MAKALAFPGPALVDLAVNPDEPPMPASITYDQAKGFAGAFPRGQPGRAAIASISRFPAPTAWACFANCGLTVTCPW